MINFVVITDTPQRLANFLVSRGIIKQETNAEGDTHYVGVRPGMEWVRMPNPIQIAPGSGTVGEPDYVWPTYDDRSVFLVKFADESEAEKAGAFRDWLMANTTPQAAPPNYKINGEPVGNARKVNGEQVWLINDTPERFGVWQ